MTEQCHSINQAEESGQHPEMVGFTRTYVQAGVHCMQNGLQGSTRCQQCHCEALLVCVQGANRQTRRICLLQDPHHCFPRHCVSPQSCPCLCCISFHMHQMLACASLSAAVCTHFCASFCIEVHMHSCTYLLKLLPVLPHAI